MKIEQSQQGTVTVLTPVGALVDADREQFEEALDSHLSKNHARIVLDLNAVPFIESEGLEMLLDASDRASSKGGGLRIVTPSDIVKDILTATRLVTKIEVFTELADARKSLL